LKKYIFTRLLIVEKVFDESKKYVKIEKIKFLFRNFSNLIVIRLSSLIHLIHLVIFIFLINIISHYFVSCNLKTTQF